VSTKEERGWNIYRRSDGQNVLQYRIAAGDWGETPQVLEMASQGRLEAQRASCVTESRLSVRE
jgi:hypothetical protein